MTSNSFRVVTIDGYSVAEKTLSPG